MAAKRGPHPARVVGTAFANKYYQFLTRSPELLPHFYQKGSILGRPDPRGEMTSVTGMDAIGEKLLSVDYSAYEAVIKTVDSHESLHGGIAILVTGYFVGKDEVKKNFTQSFFLAAQGKGYYVLNDILRLLDVDDDQPSSSASISGDNELLALVTENASVRLEPEAAGYSIHLKNLPLDVTPPQLVEVFKKFGPIKRDGVQIRYFKQSGICYGFVHFEVADAVARAMEASPVTIGGQPVLVEKKRSTKSKVSNLGRYLNPLQSATQGIRRWRSHGAARGVYGRGEGNSCTDFGQGGGCRSGRG